MQLRFLGQAYSASKFHIETIPSEYTARFLGQTYLPHYPLSTVNAKAAILKYRGVAYNA